HNSETPHRGWIAIKQNSLTSTTNHQQHNQNQTSNSDHQLVSLKAVLDAFQHNISESHAWALIFQSAQSLSRLISDYEQSSSIADGSFASSGSSIAGSLDTLEKMQTPAELILDSAGNVHSSSWAPNKASSKYSVQIKSPGSINAVVAHLSKIIYEALSFGLNENTIGTVTAAAVSKQPTKD